MSDGSYVETPGVEEDEIQLDMEDHNVDSTPVRSARRPARRNNSKSPQRSTSPQTTPAAVTEVPPADDDSQTVTSSTRGRRKRGRASAAGSATPAEYMFESPSLGISSLASEISNLHTLVSRLKESMENFESEIKSKLDGVLQQTKDELSSAKQEVRQCEDSITKSHHILLEAITHSVGQT